MPKLSRRTILKHAAFAAAATAFVPRTPALAQGRSRVVFASGLDPSFAHYVAAVRKDFLKNRGIDAEIRAFDDGNVALDSLLTGQGDIGGTSELAGIARVARGGRMHVVAAGMQSNIILQAVDRGEIQSPRDLEGKTVGTPRGSGSHFWLLKYIRHHGLDRSRVTIRFVPPPESIAAFVRRDVNVIFVNEPWPSRIRSQLPEARVFSRNGDDNIYPLNVYIYYSQRLMSDASLARNTLEGIVEATDWVRENQEEAAVLAAEQYRTTPAEARALMRNPIYRTVFPRNTDSFFQEVGEFAKSEGIVQEIPDMRPFINRDLLRAVRPSAVET